jgi:hypothetical protein
VKSGSLGTCELTPAARSQLTRARGYAQIRVSAIIPSTSFWDMALVGPRLSFGCNANEVRVMQKSNFDGAPTNQSFNIVVP